VKTEPVVSAAVITGAIVAVAAVFNVVLNTGTVETIIVAVLPVVLSLFARAKVTPV
jgi:hypothetical protein